MADIARKGDVQVRLVGSDQTEVKVDSSGRLLVSSESSTPTNTVEVVQVAQTSTNGSVDTIYTITNGKSITIQNFEAGSEANSNGGSKVTLFEDPNGNLSVLNLITVLYVNGNSAFTPLASIYAGNGTRRIVMRRQALAGGSREIFGRWKGFEA